MAVLPFWAMCFMVLKGLFILFAVYFYVYYLPFSRILPCVLHQNALHLAANRSKFRLKQPNNRCKRRCYEINIHFAVFAYQPLSASKLTSARIDYLQSAGQLVSLEGTHNVKNYTEKWTFIFELTSL